LMVRIALMLFPPLIVRCLAGQHFAGPEESLYTVRKAAPHAIRQRGRSDSRQA
jgi:hypothetical protein